MSFAFTGLDPDPNVEADLVSHVADRALTTGGTARVVAGAGEAVGEADVSVNNKVLSDEADLDGPNRSV
jgi:hypothetical protein